MDMKRHHYEDVQFLHGWANKFWFAVFVVLVIAAPYMFPAQLFLISLIGVNIIIALGLNILTGNTGQISLGHAGFVAIGAYTTVVLMQSWMIPFPAALIAGGILAMLFGVILALPALRLEGPYLAIATLAFGIAIKIILGNIPGLGGHNGISVIGMDLGFTMITSEVGIYYVIAGIALVMGIAARNIVKSRVGRAFQAIRDSDIAASAAGINLAGYKTMSFMISAFYAGIAGGLWAVLLGYINPNMFEFVVSIEYFAMVVVGGLGFVAGSVMGAAAVTYLRVNSDNLNSVPVIGWLLDLMSIDLTVQTGVTWVITGIVLILVVVLEPLGLYGIWLRIKIYWRTWPF